MQYISIIPGGEPLHAGVMAYRVEAMMNPKSDAAQRTDMLGLDISRDEHRYLRIPHPRTGVSGFFALALLSYHLLYTTWAKESVLSHDQAERLADLPGQAQLYLPHTSPEGVQSVYEVVKISGGARRTWFIGDNDIQGQRHLASCFAVES